MFQFPGFALKTLCIHVLSTCLCLLLIAKLTIISIQVGSPIQKSMDQSLFSAPHGLSQSITSFIASYCQGIHQTPFSRLIWSRKSQTCVCRSHAGSHETAFSGQKSYFPAWTRVAMFRLWAISLLLGLVYLTWTTCSFQPSILKGTRGKGWI